MTSPLEIVKEYSIKSLVSCFSGGKDSLAMTHYLHSELADTDVDLYVVYADTGVMLPIATSFVQETCEKYGWNLTIVQGNFFEKAIKIGMPRMKHRWCCWECKIRPIAEFTKPLRPQRCEAVGVRQDESVRRRKLRNEIFYLKRGRVWKYAPLLFWTEKDVLRYMKRHELPMSPHYRIGLRETCMCGVYSNAKQMLILKAQCPELFDKIVELESKFRKKGAAFFFRGKPVYAKDLAKQQILFEGKSDDGN